MIKVIKISIILFLSAVFIFLPGSIHEIAAGKNIVSMGAGSYLNALPEDINQNSEINTDIVDTKYITENMDGKAIFINRWWSSLVQDNTSKEKKHLQAAHPFLIKMEDHGIRLFTPSQNDFWVTENSFGTSIPNDSLDDLVLGNSNSTQLKRYLDNHSDWFVTAALKSDDASMKVSYGRGSPYVYAIFDEGNPVLSFTTIPNISYSSTNNQVIVFSINGKTYAAFAPQGSTWSGLGSKNVTCNLPADRRYFSIAILPSGDLNNLIPLFEKYAYNHIIDSKAEWEYRESYSEIITNYKYKINSFEGNESGTLFCLYPHQWRNIITDNILNYSYSTVRGNMKLAEGSSFTTIMSFPGILNSIPPLDDSASVDSLYTYIDSYRNISYKNTDIHSTCKHLENLASLIPIAEQIEHQSAFIEFKQELKNNLEIYFNAGISNNNNSQDFKNSFYYNSDWKTLTAYNDNFSSKNNNYYHLHYGYFIKGAAELARTEESWSDNNQYGAMVELLIRDIVSPDRNDPMFPFLRNFDVYSGSSTGHSCFNDSDNHNLPYDAVNTWASIILWGEYTNNPKIKELGIYLYTTEINSINEYWFNIYNENYPEEFNKSMTPFVGGCRQNYIELNENLISKQETFLLPVHTGSKFIEEKYEYTEKFYTLIINQLGQIDHSVIATNHALYAVFQKHNGQKTYTAYNHTENYKTVKFNDGSTLDIPPHSWGITTSS